MNRPGPSPDHRLDPKGMAGPGRKALPEFAEAAQGPVIDAISAAGTAAPEPVAGVDSAAAALGRRTLSTAFVMIGPDRHLTVGMHDGSTVVLRDVVMRRTQYCGVRVLGTAVGRKYCGDYADVATARPGGALAPDHGDTPGSDATGVVAKPFDPR